MFLSIIALLLLQHPLLPKITPLFAHLTPFIPTKSYLTHQIAPKRAWNQDKKSDLQQNKVCWELTIYPRPANFTQVYLCCLLHFPCLNDGCCNASATELLKVGTIGQNSKKNYMFYGILGPFLCAKMSVRKFGCAKELTFRRSAVPGSVSLPLPLSLPL